MVVAVVAALLVMVNQEIGRAKNLHRRIEERRYAAEYHNHTHDEVDDSAIGASHVSTNEFCVTGGFRVPVLWVGASALERSTTPRCRSG
jgi:hypothetical protein